MSYGPTLEDQFIRLIRDANPSRPVELVVWIPPPSTYFQLPPQDREPDLEDIYASAPPSCLTRHLVAPICRRVADMFDEEVRRLEAAEMEMEVAEQPEKTAPAGHIQRQQAVPPRGSRVYNSTGKRDTLKDGLERGDLRLPRQLRKKKAQYPNDLTPARFVIIHVHSQLVAVIAEG